MKLGVFLSDEAKQALNDIRISDSKEIFDKIEEIRKKGKEGAVSKPKEKKRFLYDYSDNNPVVRSRKNKERKRRKAKEEKEKKRLRIVQGLRTALIKKEASQEKTDRRNHNDEATIREQNRNRVKKTHHDYSIKTTNSIKAWSIPMGGQNKR